MKRKLLLALLSIFFVSNFAWGILEIKIEEVDPHNLRGKYTLSIPQGAFFKAILQENISTATNNKYDSITAIVPTNFYTREQICIPKSSLFEGEISELEAPKKGRNGLFKVQFNNIKTPDGTEIPVSASLWVKGSTQIGGTPSQLLEIRAIPNRVEMLSNIGYKNIVRTGEYSVGKDVTILAGTEILIKLDETLDIEI